jgi:RNA polymerase sigma factor (sigma-70 family)
LRRRGRSHSVGRSPSHHDEASIAAAESIGRAARIEPRPARADATHDLYENYSRQVFGFCVNQLGSRDEAEDAVQSTFLNAHRALQRGVTPESELAWLFKIAHNVCLTRRRSARRRVRVEAASDLQAMQDVIPAPVRESADELIRLADALAHMPENQRRAILLREWQGCSYHEIGAELGLSQSAVETLIFRARRSLAANLKVEPERTSVLARARAALDVGSLLAVAKTLFGGGAVVKAAAAAVAVSGAAVVATSPLAPQDAQNAPSAPVAVAPEEELRVADRQAIGTSERPAVAAAEPTATKPKPAPAALEPAASEAVSSEPVEAPVAVAAPTPQPEAPPSQKSTKEKDAGPPPEAAPAKQPTSDKPKRQPPQAAAPSEKPAKAGRAKKADKPVEPEPPVVLAPVVEPTEPAVVKPLLQEESKKENGHGNGDRK